MNILRKSQIIAALFLSLAAVVSCGQTQSQTAVDTGDATAAESETNAAETTLSDPAYTDNVPDFDFGGADFRFLLFGDGDPYNWSEIDILSDGADGETINDGIYARNLALEERMNIHITGSYQNATTVLNKAVQAGDDAYDAAWLQLSQAGSTAQSGSVLDWLDMPYVDLSKAYWDASIIRDLSIGGHVYFMTGDISTIDNQATWIMMFNKSMIAENDLPSPYDLVNNGTWTIDRFSEMTKDVTADVDGDGAFTLADKYGIATTPDTAYGLFYSTGLSFISKDENDFPQYTLDIDKATDVLGKIGVILNEGNRTLLSEKIKGESNVFIALRDVFIEGRSLFYAEVMFHVAHLRQMETDFGIIPLPKYDEAQEHYITFVNPAGTCLAIPATDDNPEMTGAVLEAMAALSYQYLTPAYYNIALQQKIARDNESSEMLDLLLQNRVYDLAMMYGWGGINSGFVDLAKKNSTDLASLSAKKEKQIDQAIEKFINAFEN